MDIKFENDMDYKRFISQFQASYPKLLCIINDTTLKIFDNPEQLPKNIKYVEMREYGHEQEYHYLDLDTNTNYCVFGVAAANLFYPNQTTPTIIDYTSKNDDYIIIYKKSKKYTFPNPNKMLEIKKLNIFK